jgi:hypothetical protein
MKWKKLTRKMVSSYLINQAFRPPSFSKNPAFKPHKKISHCEIFSTSKQKIIQGNLKDSLDLLEFITFPNAAEKIIQTNVVGLHKRNCPLILSTGWKKICPAHIISWP